MIGESDDCVPMNINRIFEKLNISTDSQILAEKATIMIYEI